MAQPQSQLESANANIATHLGIVSWENFDGCPEAFLFDVSGAQRSVSCEGGAFLSGGLNVGAEAPTP